MTPGARIEELVTRLIHTAPAREIDIVRELVDQLHGVATPLARSIARIIELVDEDLVDPGIALPALAMACSTLAAGLRGELGEPTLEAARYEIDTLQPMPDGPVKVTMPSIPASSLVRLSRGPRPRT